MAKLNFFFLDLSRLSMSRRHSVALSADANSSNWHVRLSEALQHEVKQNKQRCQIATPNTLPNTLHLLKTSTAGIQVHTTIMEKENRHVTYACTMRLKCSMSTSSAFSDRRRMCSSSLSLMFETPSYEIRGSEARHSGIVHINVRADIV